MAPLTHSFPPPARLAAREFDNWQVGLAKEEEGEWLCSPFATLHGNFALLDSLHFKVKALHSDKLYQPI